MEQLKITHINTVADAGGAAKFVMRLSGDQRMRGHEVHVLASRSAGRCDYVHSFDVQPDSALRPRVASREDLYYEFQGSHYLVDHPLVRSADVLHLSNLHGAYFNPWSLSALSHVKPVVWTLHDMQSITGHCAHSFHCERWRTGCGDCPDLSIYPSLPVDSTARLFRDKQIIYDHSYLQIVTPADWLRKKLAAGILRDHPVELIYNACDTKVFRPLDKAAIRQQLGIPPQAFVVGGLAHSGVLANVWKGGQYTLAVLDRLKKLIPHLLFLNIGATGKSADPVIFNVSPVQEEATLARLYNVLDVFLYTPVADTCPLVVIEALACGIPIVTYDTGGIPELVRDKRDGFVFRQGEIADTTYAVRAMHGNRVLRQSMGEYARQAALERFTLGHMTDHYLDLYHRWIDRHARQVRTIKYFDLNRVPEVIRTEAFFRAERAKATSCQTHHKSDASTSACLRPV